MNDVEFTHVTVHGPDCRRSRALSMPIVAKNRFMLRLWWNDYLYLVMW